MAVLILQSCHNSVSNVEKKSFFDIPQYFKSEAGRLQNLSPTISKAVVTKKSTETKIVHIKNWNNELAQFMSIDLNKAEDLDLQAKENKDTTFITSTKDSENSLQVKIVYSGEKPSFITIHKQTKNLLYTNSETLTYSVDNYYSIEKKQYVRGLGENLYLINSKFSPED